MLEIEEKMKYQDIISNLTEKLNIVIDIKEDVEEIKKHVFYVSSDNVLGE